MLERVTAPPAKPPRFGLIAAAPIIDDGATWQEGFSFQPEACAASGRAPVGCGDADPLDVATQPGNADSEPFVVYATDRCSSFGFDSRDWQGRARRQLAATESYQLAAELWGGSLGLDAQSLADVAATEVTTGAADPVDALAALEGGLAQCNQGRQGMVHVTPTLLTLLVAAMAVQLVGNTYVSPNGHIVVPDAGYDGSAPNGTPAGATQYAYATSMIGVRLSEVELLPGSLNDARDLIGALDRSVNTITVYAQRLAAWQWDECCHLAAHVDAPVPVLSAS